MEILAGKIQTSGRRCVLQMAGENDPILLICPGLGVALLRDVQGIRVTSGSPMVNIDCEVTGKFVEYPSTGFTQVLGDIERVIVYSEKGEAIQVDISRLGDLSPSQIEDCEYFEKRDGDFSLRKRWLDDRKAW